MGSRVVEHPGQSALRSQTKRRLPLSSARCAARSSQSAQPWPALRVAPAWAWTYQVNAADTLVVVARGQPPRSAMLFTVQVRDTIPFAARLIVYASPLATAVAVSV